MTRNTQSVADPVARFFELSVDMLGTASTDGYFTRLNPAWERTLGWTSEELMAQPLFSLVHPDDVKATADRVMKLREPDGSPAVTFENRYRTREGDYRWLEWTTTAQEGVLYFVAKDVTERKAADVERAQAAGVMQVVVESVADGLCAIDPNGRLIFINAAGVRLLGYGSADELLGCSPHAKLHHSLLDGTRTALEDCPLTKVRATHNAVHVDEDIFWRKDGSSLPVSYSSAPMDLSEGTGSVVVFRDITILQAERERLRAQVGDAAWFEEVRRAIAEDRLVLYGQPIMERRVRSSSTSCCSGCSPRVVRSSPRACSSPRRRSTGSSATSTGGSSPRPSRWPPAEGRCPSTSRPSRWDAPRSWRISRARSSARQLLLRSSPSRSPRRPS
jgi:PAS domain S-box-containing protein